MLADFDGELGQPAVEALHNIAIREAMAEEDAFAWVAAGFSGVENQSGTGGAGLVRWEAAETSGGGEAETLHGRHRAEVGLEFRGDEFCGAVFFASANFDGIARHGVSFLPMSERMGVVFREIFLMKDADRQEGDPEQYDACDDEVVTADLHRLDSVLSERIGKVEELGSLR